ncbi:MAG: hypothetical protein PHR16_09055 [Methylovulum sp.]|nr:hypothetical protein [Methylovulum sp.]
MKNKQNTLTLNKFYWGLAMFVLSTSTVLLVTDPFIMADVGLMVLGLYLMVTGLLSRKLG